MKGFETAAVLAELFERNPSLAAENATNADVQELLTAASPKAHKYHAQKTEVDGITFDSKKEAQEYARLKLLEQAGAITDLELQPKFELQAPFTDNEGRKHRGESYVADFMYQEDGKTIVVDTKGFFTAHYKSKAKRFRAMYPQYQYVIK